MLKKACEKADGQAKQRRFVWRESVAIKASSRYIAAVIVLLCVLGIAMASAMKAPSFEMQPQSLSAGQLSTQAASNWGLESINATDAKKLSTGKGVTVAILDTGFYAGHDAIKGKVKATWNAAAAMPTQSTTIVDRKTGKTKLTLTAPISTLEAATNVAPPAKIAGITNLSSEFNPNHGTHVASIVSSIAPDAELVLIRVADEDGKIPTWALYNAYALILKHQADWNIRVINFSGGSHVSSMPAHDGATDYSCVYDQIDAAFNKGAVTVCSAGNEAVGRKGAYLNFPSDYDKVVGVIGLAMRASDPHDVVRDPNSNYNLPSTNQSTATKDVSAPGKQIYGAIRTTSGTYGYGNMSGTSMAAPHVAGVLALMFAKDSSYAASGDGAQAAIYRLRSTAIDISSSGWDHETGWGEVDALAAVSGGKISGPDSVVVGYTGAYKTVGLHSSNGWTWAVSDDKIATLSNGTLTGKAAGKVTLTATSKSDASVKWTKTVTVEPVNFSKIGTSGYPISKNQLKVKYYDVTYTGSALKPSISVELGGKTLAANTDYTVSFSNNVNAGVNSAKFTITGKGKYTGSKAYLFSINTAGLKSSDIKLSKTSYSYNGSAHKPGVTVKHGGRTLVAGKDYTVSYSSNVAAGAAKVIVTAKGNYSNKVTVNFTISKINNTLYARGTTKTVAYANVKKGAQTLARPITIKRAQGKVTFAKKSGNSRITVNKKTGKITVKKGLRKGRYKVKINVTAAGNTNYKKATKVVTATIRVK